MSNYFTQFPQITYDGYKAINLLTRVAFREELKNSFETYFPYTIPEGMTAQQLAQDYYGDPTNDVLIWLINDIIDPYYGWPLSIDTFNDFIVEKYGSLAYAQLKIINWQSNWYGNENTLSIAAYEDLSEDEAQFWSPIILPGNIVSTYRRNRKDIISTTNQYETLVYNSNVAPFSSGAIIVDIDDTSSTAEVCWANSSQINIKNPQGSFLLNNSYAIQNFDYTGPVANVIVSSITPAIPADQLPYFSPVSAYDYEDGINQQKRFIKLLHVDYLSTAQQLITEALQ